MRDQLIGLLDFDAYLQGRPVRALCDA